VFKKGVDTFKVAVEPRVGLFGFDELGWLLLLLEGLPLGFLVCLLGFNFLLLEIL